MRCFSRSGIPSAKDEGKVPLVGLPLPVTFPEAQDAPMRLRPASSSRLGERTYQAKSGFAVPGLSPETGAKGRDRMSPPNRRMQSHLPLARRTKSRAAKRLCFPG